MVAPSKIFTVIPDTDIDANSPLDVDLMTSIRDSLIHLEEWLGKNYEAAVDHDHDGINSATVKAYGVYIGETTGSAVATLALTGMDATYEAYIYEIDAVPATDDVQLRIRTGLSGTYESGGTAYGYVTDALDDVGGTRTINATGGGDAIYISHGTATHDWGTGADEGGHVTVKIANPAGTVLQKMLRIDGVYRAADNSLIAIQGGGRRKATGAIDGIQVSFGSGNIESATMRLYGLVKA
jgi:hypothetical protein